MRNMAVLHSPAFSYPLPVLVRVLFNLLIFKGKILYYNKDNLNVNIESSRLAQRRFRCVINEDERLPDVLEQLCYLAPITYRIESSEIYISEKQTKK